MAFLRWPSFDLHLPYMSDWYLSSSPGQVTATLGTPEVRVSLDKGRIRILLDRREQGRTTESIALEGEGIGVGLGAGITVPFVNFGLSTTDMPGVGTRLWQTPFSPRHMEARNFKGVCWALSASHANSGAAASGVALLFCSELSLLTVSPTSINAVGLATGVGIQSSIVSLGGDVLAYTLRLSN